MVKTMAKYRLAAFDIDGTLTVSRNTVMLDLGALSSLRDLEKNGIHVVLVSSNMIPAVAALKKYIGLSGPAIGETGCIIYWGGDDFEVLTKYSAGKIYEKVLEKYSLYVYGSWQNRFRSYDYALKIKPEHRDKAEEIVESIKDFVERHDPNIKVGFSGYAIHLTPRDAGKGKALLHVLEKMRIKPSEVIGVGDSIMDYDFIRYVGLKVAVGNADDELKKLVDIVTEKPSGQGVVELVNKILDGFL